MGLWMGLLDHSSTFIVDAAGAPGTILIVQPLQPSLDKAIVASLPHGPPVDPLCSPSAANRTIRERTTNRCGKLFEPANDCSGWRCSSSNTTCSVGLPLRMMILPMEAP